VADARSFFYWLLWLAPVAAAIPAAKELLHFLQLSSYQLSGFVLTLRRQWKKAFLPGLLLALALFALAFAADRAARWMGYTNAVLAGAAALSLGLGCMTGRVVYSPAKVVKPLAVTGRVRRLVAALALVMLAAALLLRRWAPVMGLSALLPALLPLWVAVAAMIAWPFEKLVSYLFIRDAVRILDAQLGLIRIGVTGSYGKTSVKFILKTLLSEKYPVLATRQSFNTPMGVTRCIREDMRPEHRVFIAEMGARHRRDIRDLTRFVRPEIGILTAVGPQHLETLGDIDRVAETKFDLIRALPPDGFAVFYNDGICRRLYDRTAVPKAIVGLPGDDLWAEDQVLTNAGSAFTLCMKDGRRIPCETALPGEHSIRNILLAAAVALHLGISEAQLKRGIAWLRPVASRFQAETLPDGRIVINNAFNSNPESSKGALTMLAAYPGRRIIVTPGFIELGKHEDTYHFEFGQRIAQSAELVLLIGPKRTRRIADGLAAAGFPAENIRTFATLREANDHLTVIAAPGDVILYENDLPDQYTEAQRRGK
jgi:UDP-N-acetylmuramoyl-tripeptide--D-alanyl-D-alanine ligase